MDRYKGLKISLCLAMASDRARPELTDWTRSSRSCLAPGRFCWSRSNCRQAIMGSPAFKAVASCVVMATTSLLLMPRDANPKVVRPCCEAEACTGLALPAAFAGPEPAEVY